MLQWMGGSRRKVTASRKSTHNRQKQYFERKRQQQATRSKDYADGRNRGFSYHEYPCSLDVRCLNNLATVTELFCVDKDDEISQVKALKDFPEFPPMVGPLEEKIRASEVSLDFPSNRAIAETSPCTKKGNPNICVSAAIVQESPRIPYTHSYSDKAHGKPAEWNSQSFSDPCNANKTHAKVDEQQRMSEKEFSLLDLLSDNQCHSKLEGPPSGETHAAFSVKGLGKIMMETPAHSPEGPEQMESFHSPQSMATGWMCSSHNLPDDLELKRGKMDDIYLLGGDSPSVLVNADGLIPCVIKGMPLYADAYKTQDETFAMKEDSYGFGTKMEARMEDSYGFGTKMEARMGGRFGMIEDLFDDRNCDVSWNQNPFFMDLDFAKFSKIENSDAHVYGFEGAPLHYRRSAEEAWKRFDVSDRHAKSKKMSDQIPSMDNQHGVDRGPHFKSKQPAFSLTDYTPDNISLQSEESCSSAAVGNERTTNLGTDVLKLRENATKCKKVKKSQQISGAKIFTNEFVDVDINEVLQKNNPVGIENNWTMPTKWSIEAKNGLKGTPAEEENLRTQCTSFSREDHTSVSADLAPGIFYKHRTGKFLRMSDCKFNSEDVSSDLCKVPRVHMDTDSSQRICTLDHIKHDPHERTHLEKDMLRQSLDHVACLTSLHLLKREDVCQDQPYSAESEKGDKFPCISRSQKDCKDIEESDFQLADCKKIIMKPQSEILIDSRSFSSLNARTAVLVESTDHCSKHEKSKCETQEPCGSSEVRNVSTLCKTSLAPDNVRTSVQGVNNQLCGVDGWGPFSYQSDNGEPGTASHKPADNGTEREGGGSKVDTSYQLMLESYVLQLLCVHKVLLESSKQEKH